MADQVHLHLYLDGLYSVEEYREELEELIRSFSENGKLIIGADLNGHVG